MITRLETGSPKIIGFALSGKLHDEDYRTFVPEVDTAAAKGRRRLFVRFEDFHGWDLHAAWDDFKFGVKHYASFERIALVGDRRWEEWMTAFCKPFTRAEVRYFDVDDSAAAWAWLREKS
jgi:SpoIIAA-like